MCYSLFTFMLPSNKVFALNLLIISRCYLQMWHTNNYDFKIFYRNIIFSLDIDQNQHSIMKKYLTAVPVNQELGKVKINAL